MNPVDNLDLDPVEILGRGLDATISVTGFSPNALNRPLVAAVSSRLGMDTNVHRSACRFLTRCVMDCRHRGGSLLIADGSAVQPWASRAAELFGVPIVRLIVGEEAQTVGGGKAATNAGEHYLVIRGEDGAEIGRDEAVIAVADRVDAIHVRPGGNVFHGLIRRLQDRQDATTRVAITSQGSDTVMQLINAGAIGWYCPRHSERSADHASIATDRIGSEVEEVSTDRFATSTRKSPDDLVWTQTEGQWLIHCTRSCSGPWPGQTERQYRDSILLGDESMVDRGPLESLLRIVRSRRLVAATKASDREFPVVCFSATSLHERLASRCYRPHLKRWDYEPFGVAIHVAAAKRKGAMPVIYGHREDRERVGAEDRFRFQSVGKTYDWTSEREWRIKGDVRLDDFAPSDVRVFVPNAADAGIIANQTSWPITIVDPLLRGTRRNRGRG